MSEVSRTTIGGPKVLQSDLPVLVDVYAALLDSMLQKAKTHFNEPILIGFDLCRCIGYAESEEDCYLIVIDPRRGKTYCSFVGGYVFLDCLKQQGNVEWSDFTHLDTLLELNGAPKEKEFVVEKNWT